MGLRLWLHANAAFAAIFLLNLFYQNVLLHIMRTFLLFEPKKPNSRECGYLASFGS